MGDILESDREKNALKFLGIGIPCPDSLIPCIVLRPVQDDNHKFADILKPLEDLLSRKGFKVHCIPDETALGGNFEGLAHDCAMGVMVLSGSSPVPQYTYGYLKGKGKFVLAIRDAGSSNGSGLNEIVVDASADASSPENPGNKIRAEIDAYLPPVVESYISEVIEGCSSLDPERYSKLRELALELSNYYTSALEFEAPALDRAYQRLTDWEKGAGQSAPPLILLLLASLYMDTASGTAGQDGNRKEFYDKAAGICERICKSESDPLLRASSQKKLGEILLIRSYEDFQSESVERALTLIQEALEFFTQDSRQRDCASLHNDLGAAYGLIASAEDDSPAFEKSIASYTEALKYFPEDLYPLDYAFINLNIGTSYLKRAYHEELHDYCDNAVRCFREANKVFTVHDHPEGFSQTKMLKGEAFKLLSDSIDGSENLDKARKCFEGALGHYDKDTNAPMFALLNNRIGEAYEIMAGLEPEEDEKKELYNKSLSHIKSAFEVYNPIDYRPQYSLLMHMMGRVQSALGDFDKSSESIREAIETFEEALRFNTPGQSPGAYAQAHVNLGNGYRTQAELTTSPENCIWAIESYERALQVYSEGDFSLETALVYNNLGAAYDMLAHIEESAESCLKAVSHYEDALKVYTLEEYPKEYSTTENNIGNAYSTLAEIENKSENCER